MSRKTKHDDEMLSHYDFSGGVRGKYAARYTKGTSVVVLDPDVPHAVRDSVAVNESVQPRISAKAVKPNTPKKMLTNDEKRRAAKYR